MAAPAVITELRMSDYDEVLALWRATPGVGLNEADEPAPFAAYLERNPSMSFVARDGGRVVGAVLCGHDGRRGYLQHLVVTAPYRRQGLGKRLVDLCIARLREAGIGKCSIHLFADNASGDRFWRAIGFARRTDLAVLQRAT